MNKNTCHCPFSIDIPIKITPYLTLDKTAEFIIHFCKCKECGNTNLNMTLLGYNEFIMMVTLLSKYLQELNTDSVRETNMDIINYLERFRFNNQYKDGWVRSKEIMDGLSYLGHKSKITRALDQLCNNNLVEKCVYNASKREKGRSATYYRSLLLDRVIERKMDE